ncbi:hypothetical protein MIR68_002799 [Amoeboaphelidium protococcarum]|nr:hypothetical protein MIR68_002799 [Amoeboaphelidium protococcarum]
MSKLQESNTVQQEQVNWLKEKLAQKDQIYAGLSETFRSRKQMRNLVQCTYELESMSECCMAVNSYLDNGAMNEDWWVARNRGHLAVTEQQQQQQKQNIQSETSESSLKVDQQQQQQFKRQLSFASKYVPSPSQSTPQLQLHHNSGDETETIQNVIDVIVIGIKANLKAYKSHKALFYAEKMRDVIKELDSSLYKEYYVKYSCFMGLIYAKLSLETPDEDIYQNVKSTAKSHLNEAYELSKGQDAQVLYSLALYYMHSGQPDQSLSYIDQCLAQNAGNVHAVHLKVLSIAANGYQNMSQALNCIRQLESSLIGKEDTTPDPLRVMRGLNKSQQDAYLNLKITECVLLEYCQEHDLRAMDESNLSKEVLKRYKQLFDLYKIVYVPDKIDNDEYGATLSLMDQGISEVLLFEDFPAVLSLYPNLLPQSDTRGFLMQTAFFPHRRKLDDLSQINDPRSRSLHRRRMKSRFIELWLMLAQWHRRHQKFREAQICCDNARKVEPTCADVQCELGLLAIYSSGGKVDLEEFFQELTQLDQSEQQQSGDQSNTSDQLLKVIQQLTPSVLEQARGNFEAALNYDPCHLSARTLLGLIYLADDRLDLAKSELMIAIRNGRLRGSRVWQAHYFMAKIHERKDEQMKTQHYMELSQQNQECDIFDVSVLRGVEVLPTLL